MKKIAYISGTRADFGLETPLLEAIEESKELELQLFATGMHLLPEFGETVRIVRQKFPNVKIINVHIDNKNKDGMADFAAELLPRIVRQFKENRPDLVLVHGDRIEMLCSAVASLYLGIPVVHVQGGDKTTTVDDSVRHAITKLSHLHFPATEQSAKRIRMMGEEEWRIQVVGTMGVDALLRVNTLSREDLCRKLNLSFNSKIILVVLHPISEEINKAGKQMQIVLNTIKRFKLQTVIIYPNTDPGSDQIIEIINQEKDNPQFRIFKNLDFDIFVSLAKEADVWVGNSSAGVVESASFKTPVINVGSRQEGRERGNNVIDVGYDEEEIYKGIKKSLFDKDYINSLENCTNPWGDGKTTQKILQILEEIKIDNKLLKKK